MNLTLNLNPNPIFRTFSTGVVFRVKRVVVTRSKEQEVLRRNKESRHEISVETFCEVSSS